MSIEVAQRELRSTMNKAIRREKVKRFFRELGIHAFVLGAGFLAGIAVGYLFIWAAHP